MTTLRDAHTRSSHVIFVKGSWMSPATHVVARGQTSRAIVMSSRGTHIAVLGRSWMRSVPGTSHRTRIVVVEAG